MMVVRVLQKRAAFAGMERGRLVEDVEVYERARLSLRCMTALVVLWSGLIVLYFFR